MNKHMNKIDPKLAMFLGVSSLLASFFWMGFHYQEALQEAFVFTVMGSFSAAIAVICGLVLIYESVFEVSLAFQLRQNVWKPLVFFWNYTRTFSLLLMSVLFAVPSIVVKVAPEAPALYDYGSYGLGVFFLYFLIYSSYLKRKPNANLVKKSQTMFNYLHNKIEDKNYAEMIHKLYLKSVFVANHSYLLINAEEKEIEDLIDLVTLSVDSYLLIPNNHKDDKIGQYSPNEILNNQLKLLVSKATEVENKVKNKLYA